MLACVLITSLWWGKRLGLGKLCLIFLGRLFKLKFRPGILEAIHPPGQRRKETAQAFCLGELSKQQSLRSKRLLISLPRQQVVQDLRKRGKQKMGCKSAGLINHIRGDQCFLSWFRLLNDTRWFLQGTLIFMIFEPLPPTNSTRTEISA